MNAELLLYCQKITPRFRYIAGLILTDILGLQISLTDSEEDYVAFNGARICYHNHQVNPGKEVVIIPSGLLTEK